MPDSFSYASSSGSDEDRYPYSWESRFTDEVSPDLCDTCQNTIFKARTWEEIYDWPSASTSRPFSEDGIHHQSYNGFRSSVEQGCYICVKLYRTLPVNLSAVAGNMDSAKSKFSEWGIYGIRGSARDSLDCGRFSVKLGSWASTENLKDISIYFDLSRTNEKDTDTWFEALNLPSTSSTEAWNRAKWWINKCTTEHGCCAHLTSPENVAWYPTRLIEIFGNDEPDRQIRLIETKDKAPDGPYITLSHCWGNSNMARLKRSNLEEFKANISKLPQTFNDVITAAWQFQVKYIWIDCLCIVQDEISDWQSECAIMDRVYRNAFFNIGATSSDNSHGGLFFDRPKSKPCTVVLSVGRGRETFLLVDPKIFEKDIADSPLLKRGWVLQERLLAPRVLHFAGEQLYWECKELCASETYPYGLPSVVRRDNLQKVLKEIEKESLVGRGPMSLLKLDSPPSFDRSYEEVEGAEEINEEELKLWYRIVKAYSQTSLTFASDKLPALSGIAKFFQRAPKNTYLAGIWKAHLPVGLAWYRSHGVPKGCLPRPEEYRAPTWSWMSIDSPVTIHQYSASPILRIIDAQSSPNTVDPTGPVSGGFLVVEGTLMPSTWKRPDLWINQKEIWFTHLFLDEPQNEAQLDEEIEGFALPLLEYNYTVKQTVNFQRRDKPESCIAFLFLQPLRSHPGHFIRIGMGMIINTYRNSKLGVAKDISDGLGVTFLGKERGYRLTIV